MPYLNYSSWILISKGKASTPIFYTTNKVILTPFYRPRPSSYGLYIYITCGLSGYHILYFNNFILQRNSHHISYLSCFMSRAYNITFYVLSSILYHIGRAISAYPQKVKFFLDYSSQNELVRIGLTLISCQFHI